MLNEKFFYLYSSNLEYSNDSSFQKIKNLLIFYFFGSFIIVVVVLIIINPLDFLITRYFHLKSVNQLISLNHKKIIKFPFYIMIFIVLSIEEILFRLGFKVTKINISIFIGLTAYLLLGGKIIKFEIQNQIGIIYILITFTMAVISYFYMPSKIFDFLDIKKKWLITASIISFGTVHILNIKIFYWQLLLFYPFYVLPQMIMGFFITNLRLKYGFVWGLLLHAFFNTINFLLSRS